MDFETMAMCQPKVIDLDTYTYAGADLSTILLMLFQDGGGTRILDETVGLFDNLKTNRPIKVKFTFGAVVVNVMGVTIVTTAGSDNVAQLCFECVINTGTTVYRVAAMFLKSGADGTAITLVRDIL